MDSASDKKNNKTKVDEHAYQAAPWEKVSVFFVALFVLGLIATLVIRNEPFADPNIVVFVRTLLALAVAIFGAVIPGFLHIGWTGRGWFLRAGGACALFVLVYFFTPKVLEAPAKASESRPPPAAQTSAVTDGSPLQFQQIEIDDEHCQWSAITRPFETYAQEVNPASGERFSFLRPTIGTPQQVWPMGCHQISNVQQGDADQASSKVSDPIFSIVLTNVSDKPVTLSAIGVSPVAAWDAVKGAPCVVKLRDFDAISLKLDGFDPTKPALHRLSDPISIGRNASYRIKLRLADYNRAVPRNESAIKFIADVNQRRIYSEPLYLGLCELLEAD
jgi:hypothetical protein